MSGDTEHARTDPEHARTEAGETIGVGPGTRTGPDSPLLGRDPRRTRLGLAALAAVVVLFALGHLAAREIAGVRAQTVTPAFDALSAIVILVSVAVVLAGPFAYAIWNGGPALAFAVPVVPIAFGQLVAGRYVLDVDAAVALTTGGAGAAVACYAADVGATGSLRPWRFGPIDRSLGMFALVVGTAAGAATVRFVLVAPDRLVAAYAPFATLWLVPVAVAAPYAGARLGSPAGAVGDAIEE